MEEEEDEAVEEEEGPVVALPSVAEAAAGASAPEAYIARICLASSATSLGTLRNVSNLFCTRCSPATPPGGGNDDVRASAAAPPGPPAAAEEEECEAPPAAAACCCAVGWCAAEEEGQDAVGRGEVARLAPGRASRAAATASLSPAKY